MRRGPRRCDELARGRRKLREELASYAVLRIFKHHTASVTSLALLPDGLRFVSGSFDRTARIAYHAP